MSFSRRAFLAAFSATPAMAAGFWQKKKFPKWSDKDVRKLLTNSPWAQSDTISVSMEGRRENQPETWRDMRIPGNEPDMPGTGVGRPGESPVGGLGAPLSPLPTSADMLLRWSSSLPIRQALVIHRLGAREAGSTDAKEILKPDEANYVIEIFGLPAITAHRGAQVLQKQLYDTAQLVTKSGRVIRPESVYTPIEGLFVVVVLRFPRTKPITLDDKYVDCLGSTDIFKFNMRFHLRSMLYGDSLEL